MGSKSKSPVFPMPTEPHHFSDYGFDPQIDYFQFLEEAKKHKRDSTTTAAAANSIDTLHFKLQKPVSKDESLKTTQANKTKIKKRWWKNALVFFKLKWAHRNSRKVEGFGEREAEDDVHRARARAFRATMSGPVYITESRSGSNTPYRFTTTTSRPASGPLAGSLSPAVKGDIDLPYVSLRELNMEQQQKQRMSTSAMPIYLVT
ncbi:unnamed protein product [Linum trigynum]|uniref:Uncharacterized protein n=1 Tax=Linum trigynum TaxID=586398 RepID=A0AAV2GS88_9ROSI